MYCEVAVSLIVEYIDSSFVGASIEWRHAYEACRVGGSRAHDSSTTLCCMDRTDRLVHSDFIVNSIDFTSNIILLPVSYTVTHSGQRNCKHAFLH